MKKFLVDILLEGDDICNLVQDTQKLLAGVVHGDRQVFVGRRNTGKTSLIKGRVLPAYTQSHPEALIVFVDLMGVKTLDQISHRMQKAFEDGMAKLKPTRTYLQKLMKTLRLVRPNMSVDPMTGTPEFSLGLAPDSAPISFTQIIAQVGVYQKEKSVILVMDEFQDIWNIPEAQALFRSALQQLPGDLPVIAMGSKKHVLAKIFAAPGAPLAQWGRQVEISQITAEDYTPYFNTRLNPVGLQAETELIGELIEQLDGIPEAINLVGDWWQRHCNDVRLLTTADIYTAIAGICYERHSLYLEYLNQFSEKEARVLHELAKVQPLSEPLGSKFISKVKMSPGGLGPLIKRLEDGAVIYKKPFGFVVGDPIFAAWLTKHT
jgi:hypothetical protein